MKQTEEIKVVQELKNGFPKAPGHYEERVKKVLTEQLAGEKAGKGSASGRKKRWIPILAAAVLFCTGAAVTAGTGGMEKLRQWLGAENEKAAQELLQPRTEVQAEVEEGEFSGPLWKVTDIWYDGAYLNFYGETTEEGRKYSLGSDHIYINGDDNLLNYYEDENGNYPCNVNLAGKGFTGDLEVDIPLKVWNRAGKLAGKQHIRFTVKAADGGTDFGAQEIELESGRVKVERAEIFPSGAVFAFTYCFSGENAREQAEQVREFIRFQDGKGNVADSLYSSRESLGAAPAYQDEKGNWCRELTMNIIGLDVETDSVTVTPYEPECDEEGRVIPDTGKDLKYGVFTIANGVE